MMRWSLIEKIVGVKIAVGFHNTIYMVINPAYNLCSYTGRKCEESTSIVQKIGNEVFPARVHILQRVVLAVRISVIALSEVGHLYEVVGGEEAGNHRVVQTPVC